jgi:hypothetical protein
MKRKIESAKEAKQEAEGSKKALITQLKSESGCESYKDAYALCESKRADIEKEEVEIKELTKQLEEKL